MDLLSTRSYTTRDGETKNAFTKIGVAFATKNGGWSLTFEALPLPSLNDKGQIETRVLMMPPRQDGDAPPARQQPASGGYNRDKGARQINDTGLNSFNDTMDDTIPF